jgi:thiol-disulfide isomerase/thioredoxin
MTSRRALVLVLMIGAFLVAWGASRYALQVRGGGADTAMATPAAADPDGGERMTLHFFRNPAPAPVFTARDLDGREVSSASVRGKVLLVNFWATWCPPCRAEIPDLVRLQEKYRDRLQIIGISEDESAPEVVKRFAADHKMNYPTVMTSPEIEKMFPGVSALPTSFLIDRDSRVVQKHVGMLTARTTEYELRALAGLPVNASIEEVDQTQRLKLDKSAQAISIPGIDLAKLSAAKRTEALEKLNAQPCTCGCDLTVARCRVDDPTCGVSLPLARQIVAQLTGAQ